MPAPYIWKDEMWVCEECEDVEPCAFPTEFFTPEQAVDNCDGHANKMDGWWYELRDSDMGPIGPYTTEEAAREAVICDWDIDPDTGEDWESKMERQVAEFEFDGLGGKAGWRTRRDKKRLPGYERQLEDHLARLEDLEETIDDEGLDDEYAREREDLKDEIHFLRKLIAKNKKRIGEAESFEFDG